ncbi:hypothetical protein K402DRAFT_407971 [Aulographum hederae CBS 113979]|uniref:HAUS augmin-like complex subunit 1 n=1 Tax=Aulographum hederae CBS 113979 TaxID=1176131 RepID=A0A6G1GMA6_9PEZI|nr:hypothetical protein K402DRAFT_407971 [Aulographum hederae CBS 113979]
MDATLSPSALFSPSKAAQQRAQAQDWHHVDTWLSSKYPGRSVPSFERNEDTLAALIALAGANERADEERELVWAIEKAALKDLTDEETAKNAKNANSVHQPVLPAILSQLPGAGQEHLESLSALSVAANAPSSSANAIAHAVVAQTTTFHTLSQHLAHLTALHSYLQNHIQGLRLLLSDVKGEQFKPPRELPKQTADWTRNTKILKGKIREYEERLANLTSGPMPGPSPRKGGDVAFGGKDATLGKLAELEESILDLRNEVQLVEKDVRRYEDLPPSMSQARKKVELKELELNKLRDKRDRLFEALVERT